MTWQICIRDSSAGEQIFVTTDLFLHSYHLIFDRMLQDIEEKKFLPDGHDAFQSRSAKTADSRGEGSAPCGARHA